MLKKIFMSATAIIGLACYGVFSFPQLNRTISYIAAIGKTEVGLGWSLKDDPSDAAGEAIAMALAGKQNKNPNVAIMFAKTGSNVSAIHSKAREVFNDKTKLYGGSSDPQASTNNKGYIYIKNTGSEKKLAEKEKGIVTITISSKDLSFGVGSSDLSKSNSVHNAAKTATLAAIKNSGELKGSRPKLVFLMSTPSLENEAVRGVKEVLDRAYIILCGSAEKKGFSIFADKNVYTSGVSVAVVYTKLPIGLNIIQRAFGKIKMPQPIKNLLALRLNTQKA